MTVNIGLALAIIIGLFPLALFGVLGLAGVVLVHEVAEVIVILNGIRAARRPAALCELTPAPSTPPVPAHVSPRPHQGGITATRPRPRPSGLTRRGNPALIGSWER